MLHECVERVPENVDAAKELLQYGLKGTDLEALIAIGNGEDGGRCVPLAYTHKHSPICVFMPGLIKKKLCSNSLMHVQWF